MEINPPVQSVKPVAPIQAPPAMPGPTPNPVPLDNKPPSSPPVEKSPRIISPYLLMLILFVIGIGLGYAMTKVFPGNKTTNTVQQKIVACKQTSQKISCPKTILSPTPVTASPSAEVNPSGEIMPSIFVQPSPILRPTNPFIPSPTP